MKKNKETGVLIILNHELLANIIRGHLSNYYDKKLNASDINTLTEHLIDSIDDFMNIKDFNFC